MITNRASRAAVAALVLLWLCPLAVVLGSLLARTGSTWTTGIAVLSVVVLAAWRVSRQQVRITSSGVIIVDFFRTTQLMWSDIKSVAQADPDWGIFLARGQQPGWWLRFELADGRRRHPGALARWRNRDDWPTVLQLLEDRFA